MRWWSKLVRVHWLAYDMTVVVRAGDADAALQRLSVALLKDMIADGHLCTHNTSHRQTSACRPPLNDLWKPWELQGLTVSTSIHQGFSKSLHLRKLLSDQGGVLKLRASWEWLEIEHVWKYWTKEIQGRVGVKMAGKMSDVYFGNNKLSIIWEAHE